MENCCVVISGLPASGKTSLGRALAQALNFELFDKDVYLEALFEERGIGDALCRQALSRESDQHFQRQASEANAAVLVSHWRWPENLTDSGTPMGWISEVFSQTVHVYCHCPPETAAQRFIQRERHPGHLDAERSDSGVLAWMVSMAACSPLPEGSDLRVDTCNSVDITTLVQCIRDRFVGLER